MAHVYAIEKLALEAITVRKGPFLYVAFFTHALSRLPIQLALSEPVTVYISASHLLLT